MVPPSVLVRSPGLVTTTRPLTSHANVTCALDALLAAVTVVANGPAADVPTAMVPEIRPVVGLMASPGGRSEAEYRRDAPLLALAWICSDTWPPSVAVCAPGLASVTGLCTAQLKVRVALCVPSVAVTLA